MSRTFDSHRSVIDSWPSLAEFASEIGVPYGTAKAMRRRDSIPIEHIPSVVAAASQRSIEGVSADLLTQIAAARARNRSQKNEGGEASTCPAA